MAIAETLGIGGGAGFIETINGDTGSITGTTVTIYANNASQNCGSTVKFVNGGTTSTFNVTDGFANTLIGLLCGPTTITSFTVQNTGIGSGALRALNINADNNTAVGYHALNSVQSGSRNIGIGTSAGSAYHLGDGSNIAIGNAGSAGNSNEIRIGTQGSGLGQQNKCFIAGITGVTTSNSQFVTIDTVTGQLGSTSESPFSDSFVTDSGTATPSSGVLNINAGNSSQVCGASVKFSGSSNTVQLSVTDGGNNTIIGGSSGNATFSGTSNTVIGGSTFASATSGASNVLVGYEAGKSITTAIEHVAIGYQALQNYTGGLNSVAIGSGALAGVVFGNDNTAIGRFAGNSYTAGDANNICIGSGVTGTSGHSNEILIGNSSNTTCFIKGIAGVTVSNTNMVTIDTTTGQLGSQAVPSSSISFITDSGTATTSGGNINLISGVSTINSGASVKFTGASSTVELNLTDASNNTFLGKLSGNATLTGNQNTCIGYSSGHALTNGQSNCLIGYNSGLLMTSGGSNIAIGSTSLRSLTIGTGNIAIGDGVLPSIINGSNNIVIGQLAGTAYNGAQSLNILIGNTGNVVDITTTRIGEQTGGARITRCFIAGITGVTTSNSQLVTIDTVTGQLGAVTEGGFATSFVSDVGSAAPSGGVINVISDVASLSCGATVLFIASGNTIALNVTDGALNTAIGLSADSQGTHNTILGYQAGVASTSNNSIFIGEGTGLGAYDTGSVYIGYQAGANPHDSNDTLIGCQSGTGLSGSAAGNTFVGFQTGINMVGSTNSTLIGYQAGGSYTGTDANNICIGSGVAGTSGHSNEIIIGNASNTTCFIKGIAGVTTSNSQLVTINTTTGQLGSTSESPFADSFVGDSGTATPSSGVLTIQAGFFSQVCGSLKFSGSGSTISATITNGTRNTYLGLSSGGSGISGADNTSLGSGTLQSLTSGNSNVAIGSGAGQSLTGSNNILLGKSAGSSYTSESSNITLGNSGTVSDANVIRIGTQGSGSGQQNTCFVAGIAGVTGTSSAVVTGLNTANGQLLQTTITAGAGISVTPSAGIITIASSGTTWTDEGTNFSAAANNGYFISAAATATLPASPSQGNTISFAVDTTSALTITANTGQTIRVGSTVSASAGTAVSTARGDSVTLVYRSSDTSWIATSVIGNWTIT